MKRAVVIIGIVLIAAAYVFGFWPQYQKAQRAEKQLEAVTSELASARAQVRLCRLQQDLLEMVRETNQKNYGLASTLSSKFFNSVGDELPRQTDPKVTTALQSILQQRDPVTAALAKGDPSVMGLLQPMEKTMFQAVDESLGTTGNTAGSSDPGGM
jgi:type II secretory pathway pseudopilin PulG